MTPREIADRLEDDELVSLALLKQAAEMLRRCRTDFELVVAYDCGYRIGEEVANKLKEHKMILSHNELVQIVNDGVIVPVDYKDINAASIDIHLGDTILWEDEEPPQDQAIRVVDYSRREPVAFNEYVMDADGWVLEPGDFILAQSREVFNLPNHISAEYKLKSSMARIGLEHMNAGWCDAGWNGSVLTLELKNMCNHHAIRIRPGDAIGQMIFFAHTPVPDQASYATKGRYNGDKSVSGIKE